MDKPLRASDSPYEFAVEAGKVYFWCACGRSRNQPLCDGSHRETSFGPFKYTAEVSRKVFFCGCKGTMNQPFCDGSHKKTAD